MVGGGTRRRRGGPAGSPDARVSSAIDRSPVRAPTRLDIRRRPGASTNSNPYGSTPNRNVAAKHLPLIIAYCGAAAAATAALSRRIDESEERRLVRLRRHRQAGDAGLAEHAGDLGGQAIMFCVQRVDVDPREIGR